MTNQELLSLDLQILNDAVERVSKDDAAIGNPGANLPVLADFEEVSGLGLLARFLHQVFGDLFETGRVDLNQAINATMLFAFRLGATYHQVQVGKGAAA